ncbi:UNVERIFIED_CONTAM: hypothetical protein Sradi_4075100 [Sesamum radiatum]|uniref:Uncharacterized protein n=1 Tax=Sesamum radiatum TaxID=300843 RepID=A0AAW2PJ39_SESRA
MEHLEKLKLVNDVYPSPPSEGQLTCLPSPFKFPRKLKFLTLSFTYLEWRYMSVLGMLEYLEVLKLKENAFVGKVWEAVDDGFRHLECLQIEQTDLVYWTAASHHFPRLRRLVLRNCEELAEVPFGLADITSLQVMDLYRTTKSAAYSAKKIQLAKQEAAREMWESTPGGFKLSIFPPYSD